MSEPIEHPCPRCGGEPAPRRMPTASSPFLVPHTLLTCLLCGLEYERDTPPWRPLRDPEDGAT